MQINFAGRSHGNSFSSSATPNQYVQPQHQDADAMDIDPPDTFAPVQQRSPLSAQERALKRIREQRKADVQINSRQTLLEKSIMAKNLIEQRNKHEISADDFVQAMADLRALKLRY